VALEGEDGAAGARPTNAVHSFATLSVYARRTSTSLSRTLKHTQTGNINHTDFSNLQASTNKTFVLNAMPVLGMKLKRG